jgi:hypothetical protein
MRSIRCGRGLGDSIYLQSVVRHLVRNGPALRVKSDYPDVYLPLGRSIEVVPFTRQADITAHYSSRKSIPATTQFQDCCINAGIREPVDLRLDWTMTNQWLVDRVRKPGKPVLVVQLPRAPMGRLDGFGKELLPDCRAIQRLIDEAKGSHTLVQIGAGEPLFRFRGIDIDLANETTVAEMIDVASLADGFLGYVSFMVPLAESLRKPALFVWSRAGLRAAHPYVRQITPSKVLCRKTSSYVMDDATEQQIVESLDALRLAC